MDEKLLELRTCKQWKDDSMHIGQKYLLGMLFSTGLNRRDGQIKWDISPAMDVRDKWW